MIARGNHGSPEAITTDRLASYKAAMKAHGNTAQQKFAPLRANVHNL